VVAAAEVTVSAAAVGTGALRTGAVRTGAARLANSFGATSAFLPKFPETFRQIKYYKM